MPSRRYVYIYIYTVLEVRRVGAGCHPVTFLNFENHPTPFLMHILGWDAIPVHNKIMEILFYFPPINKLVKTILKFAAICEFK